MIEILACYLLMAAAWSWMYYYACGRSSPQMIVWGLCWPILYVLFVSGSLAVPVRFKKQKAK